MSVIINLAVGKNTTQSSVISDAGGRTLETDAALAVTGNIDTDACFHTNREPEPWWQVDLGQLATVYSVVLTNRKVEAARCRNFSVLCSQDGNLWRSEFRKSDPSVFQSIEIHFSRPVKCRYFRIRQDNDDYFHLRQVAILGYFDVPSSLTSKQQPPKTLFSVLYSESREFLPFLVNNLLFYTDANCHFTINFPPNFDLSGLEFLALDRIEFVRSINARKANGHYILSAHLENLLRTRVNDADFAYFRPIASNCLFIRHYNFETHAQALLDRSNTSWHIASADATYSPSGCSVNSDEWNFPKIAREPAFLELVCEHMEIETLVPMQLEGLLASFEAWRSLSHWKHKIDMCGHNLNEHNLFPMEEILPASYFKRHFGGHFTTICQMLWYPFRSQVTMPELILVDRYWPIGIVLAKWFERDAGVPETRALSTSKGRELLILLQGIVETGSFQELSATAQLLGRYSSAIESLAPNQSTYRIIR